jgi:hypothetical protein
MTDVKHLDGTYRINVWNPDDDTRENDAQVYRPCLCGCSSGDWVGYLCVSNSRGRGLTLYLDDEETYQKFRAVYGGQP